MGARDVFASFTGPRDWDDSYYSYGFLWIQVHRICSVT
ncbi:hypothetical protein GCK32_021009 [Trichostrongylus colubriformis]|uniref:Uncharacterized protein n=1 Tax=Trichostrongylus colubriformis TaxID=6319 RepID=A0AAN8IIC6_TRICO